MKLGIGLPNTMAHETDRGLMLDWARLADEADFHVLGTIDKPNFDSCDLLVTLAGVARVTALGIVARPRGEPGRSRSPKRSDLRSAQTLSCARGPHRHSGDLGMQLHAD